jgi:hypothetical protein
MERTFNDNHAVRLVGSPAAWAAAAVYTDWTSMVGFRRCTFLVGNGELDANMAMAVYEAKDATGTDAQAISGLSDTFHNGADEDRAGIIEVRDTDLTVGYPYVALLVTPGAADSFCAFAVLGEPYDLPCSNTTTDGVAFVTGE